METLRLTSRMEKSEEPRRRALLPRRISSESESSPTLLSVEVRRSRSKVYKFRNDFGVKSEDMRQWLPRLSDEGFPKNQDKFQDKVRAAANRHGATPGQTALVWILFEHPTLLPIPRSRTVARLEENAKEAEIQCLPRTCRSSMQTSEARAGDPAQLWGSLQKDSVTTDQWKGELWNIRKNAHIDANDPIDDARNRKARATDCRQQLDYVLHYRLQRAMYAMGSERGREDDECDAMRCDGEICTYEVYSCTTHLH
ncbi:uncharacterized protein LAESUDRAFT_816221 [Laetiporus sulphureus 93-53]|uniref:Uncharacterized protein n=1 Tax=Laetiporus sulphureus 93-53 TaxID=1314785 RepID=A0A165BFQ4_9APHY|nr:uncharacterized protein LAESUDRAFT_816221 [Laetiporus sulphureus 93-53]KZT00960.1 hypothetical protein LAESUDRAFT_816221 [Laetiporus sulphureus 93-53]